MSYLWTGHYVLSTTFYGFSFISCWYFCCVRVMFLNIVRFSWQVYSLWDEREDINMIWRMWPTTALSSFGMMFTNSNFRSFYVSFWPLISSDEKVNKLEHINMKFRKNYIELWNCGTVSWIAGRGTGTGLVCGQWLTDVKSGRARRKIASEL